MRKYRAALILSTTIVAALLLTLVWRAEDTRTLRWAHVYEISSPYHQQTVAAAREFERLTNGRYRHARVPGIIAWQRKRHQRIACAGAVDLIYTGASFVAAEYPPIALSDFPYAIEDFDHWQTYRNSPLFEEISTGFGQATGSKVIGLTYYGFRHVTSNRAILRPDDMRNLKSVCPMRRCS